MLNRRYFLAAGAGSLASLGFPLATLATTLPGTTATVPGTDRKTGAVCSVYRHGQVIARLKQTRLSTPSRPDPRLDQFTLNFEAVAPVDLPEGSYEVSHPAMGRHHLFLQPCGTLNQDEHDGRHYRACIALFR